MVCKRSVADVKGRLGTCGGGRGINRNGDDGESCGKAWWDWRVVRKRNTKSGAKSVLRVRARRWTLMSAGAAGEDMASQEEQRNAGVVRERIPETSTPAASAPASTPTPPYRCQPDDDKIKSMKRKAARPPRRLGRALQTLLPCGLSRAVVQEPYDPPNVQIRHRSRVAHASYAPTDQAGWAKGTRRGMMGAGNVGGRGECKECERNTV